MKKSISVITLLIAFALSCVAQSEYVNPFVGTAEHGHTYPGAILPFGAIQVSPDTRLNGWDGCSGYHYSDSKIYGFSHTHLNGTGCEDYCDILVTPFTGEPSVLNDKYALSFNHKNETASPGYYSVKFDNGISAEMTTANYVGVHRYKFPKNGKRGIIVDLSHRDKTLESYMTQKANDLVGFRRSESWSTDQYCAFSLKTSVTPSEIVYYVDDNPVNIKELKGTNCKAVLYFDNNVSEVVVKVAISAVDIDGAINNQTEIKDFNFDQIRKNAVQIWNKELGKITVETNNKEYLKTFYTALYHSFTSPYLYSDLDGRYRGTDNKIHRVDGDNKVYTVFSLWDTYRALHPLLNIIDQKRSSDFMYTFVQQYRRAGYLPMWELSSFETWCMIGYHAVPVVYDAYMKGIRNFSGEEMLNAMIATANLKRLGRPEYAKYGYVPGDMDNESVSKTLEYAYDDWCIAMFAKEIGNGRVYQEYIRRAQSYKNIIDEAGFMHGRMNGGFVTPFDPREVNNFYTEGNSWQYSTYVPHDFLGYQVMMGGRDNVEKQLDVLFNSSSKMTGRVQSDLTGVIGQYAHGNEPSHHAAYLYNFVGKPEKTQVLVKKILTTLYTSAPDGLCGNEDCGQMSAWYVFSSMGFYPVCPGNNQYIIGYPLFDKVVMKLENGRTFTVTRDADKPYIQSATLNGKPLTRSYITYEEISNGGVLEFKMSDTQSQTWGKGKGNEPSTGISAELALVPVPVFSTDKVSFEDKTTVSLSVPEHVNQFRTRNTDMKDPKKEAVSGTPSRKNAPGVKIDRPDRKHYEIFYTIDGSEPSERTWMRYTEPIVVDKDMTIKAVAVDHKGSKSKVSEAHYVRYTRDKDITYITKPDPQYYAGGDAGLIDNLRGNVNYRIGGWQGFTGDFEAVLDLNESKKISSVNIGFLQEQRAWIFFPREVEVSVSNDGKKYQPFGSYNLGNIERQEGAQVRNVEVNGKANARYVKVKVYNYGKLPEWHISAGENAWLFIDEISIK